MKAIRNPESDPEWDTIGITSTDFRPHWEGDIVNVYSCVYPNQTKSETEQLLITRTREMAAWVLAHQGEFGLGDRFQLILGWPKSIKLTGRQIIKEQGDRKILAKIADGTSPIFLYPGWDDGVFGQPGVK